MGLFKKKKDIDLNGIFKEKYQSINQLTNQMNQEYDFKVKESLYALIVETYNELIDLIDQGATFEKDHFISLREHALKEYEKIKGINQDDL